MNDLLVGVGVATPEEAVTAEALGYDFVSASDHPVGTQPSYETLTLLTWIAARTSRIAVASRVLGVPFRRPGVVAKAAESLQRLSGGRLILGLGAGYLDDEIRALGGPVDRRIEGLAEAISIMRAAWSEPSVTYHGRVHSVEGLTIEPKPDTSIPIWLGTFGPRALAATGRLADGWIPSLGHVPLARFPEMFERIRTASVAAGRPEHAVRAVCNIQVRVEPGGTPAEDIVTGSPANVLDQLGALRELGFNGFNVIAARPSDVHEFAENVLPALRDDY